VFRVLFNRGARLLSFVRRDSSQVGSDASHSVVLSFETQSRQLLEARETLSFLVITDYHNLRQLTLVLTTREHVEA